MLYFAYGMNTNIDSMAERCPAAMILGAAKLPHWRFRFAGCADIIPSEQDVTDGVLWDITEECLYSLDILEGYPGFYNRDLVKVYWQDQFVDALVYFMNPGIEDDLPSDYYREMVYDGYIENNVPTDQLNESLARLEQIEWSKRVLVS